jgi:hypothetical protein
MQTLIYNADESTYWRENRRVLWALKRTAAGNTSAALSVWQGRI